MHRSPRGNFYLVDHRDALIIGENCPKQELFRQESQYYTTKKSSNNERHNISQLFREIRYGSYGAAPKPDKDEKPQSKRGRMNNDCVPTWKNAPFSVDVDKFPNFSVFPAYLSAVVSTTCNSVSLHYSALFNRFNINNSQRCIEVKVKVPAYGASKGCKDSVTESTYILPPNSSFFMADMKNFKEISRFTPTDGYHVITIDPPWRNKSVRRGKTYATGQDFHLYLDIPSLLQKCGSVVAVWCTNKRAHISYVLNNLFKTWNLILLETCFWLKVTDKGIPIVPFDSTHKKPYELLFISQHRKNYQHTEFLESDIDNLVEFPIGLLPDGEFNKDMGKDKFIIASIPCVQHSRKPPLTMLKERYFVDRDINCLEIFARSLNSGWCSVGNEVLLFQNKLYYT